MGLPARWKRHLGKNVLDQPAGQVARCNPSWCSRGWRHMLLEPLALMRVSQSITAMPCRISVQRPCLRSMRAPHRPSQVEAVLAHSRGPNEIPGASGNRTGAPQVLRPHKTLLSARMHGLRGMTEQRCTSDLHQDADTSTSNQAMLDSTKTETAIFGLG